MSVFTIGFTGKTAETFFSTLKESGAKRVVDIRINRTSQLAGFAKEQDLQFFLPKIVGMDYSIHEELAPTKELLASYRDKKIQWDEFATKYRALIDQRDVLKNFTARDFDGAVLLCSENEPEKCHRTLLANLIMESFPDLKFTNLM